MFNKLDFMSFKCWLTNGWYYVRFYFLAYLTNYFNAIQPNPENKAGYELVFHDEFDEPEIDWNIWSPCERWGCIRTNTVNEYIIYKQEQVAVRDGNVELTSALNQQPPEPPVKSGQLTTWKSFIQQYGFFETREKLPPNGINNWSSFWGYPVDAWPPELDVFEIMGTNSSYITMTLHYADLQIKKAEIYATYNEIWEKYGYRSTNPDDDKKFDETIAWLRDPWTQEKQEYVDILFSYRIIRSRSRRLKFPKKDFLAQGYHTYSLLWTKDKVVWYIDNLAVYTLDRHIPQRPFYWLVANAVKEYDVKTEQPPATLPSTAYCDYFRAYKELD